MLKKNAILRKSLATLKQIPRKYRTILAKEEDYRKLPPVLCNSFPKSGTHLLLQIVSAFPDVVNFGTVAASLTSSFRFRLSSTEKMRKKLTQLAPGEVAIAHLFYEPSYHEALQLKNVAHYFIYRDPRDVAVSEAYYLTFMNRWHRLHKYFKSLESMEERILFAIRGATDANFPYYYPDINQRFQDYNNWLNNQNVFAVRFEDIVGPDKKMWIEKMVNFYLARTTQTFDKTKVVTQALAAIEPNKSHTFREGKIGGWRQNLSLQHKQVFLEIAGNLLIELGYESGKNWVEES